jgi:acetylglutamate kinase
MAPPFTSNRWAEAGINQAGINRVDQVLEQAAWLAEALRRVRPLRQRPSVIKLGGSAMEDADTLAATLADVVALAELGLRPVLVHGGGKPIDRAMAEAGLTPRKIQGRRYTDEATLAVVVRVLRETINADLVARLRQAGGRAVGLHTGPLQALHGQRLLLPGLDLEPIDLGRVGQVTRVDVTLIDDFASAGIIPVIPSLAYDDAGGWLNVNADTAAAAVANALHAERLLVISDTPGLLRDRSDPASLIPRLDRAGCLELIRAGVIEAGMIPKVEAALECLDAGVGSVRLLDGRLPHVLLADLLAEPPLGTTLFST